MRQHNLGKLAAILNMLDALTTLYAVYMLGAVELNPLMAWVLDIGPLYGATFFLMFKLLISIGMLIYGYSKRNVRSVFLFIVVLYSLVVTSNIFQIAWSNI